MCGIAGIVVARRRAGAGREALLRMAGALTHRGPDELGLYRDAGAGLAHARLSIIDLATGQQPMADALRTRGSCSTARSSITSSCAPSSSALGHRFRTRSDTEVIVQAWHAWGERAFERFNGQWAVALWDSMARRLVLARDPTGICPLHLCEHAGQLYFASEVKAIFAANPAIPRAFDPAGIEQTFTFWSVVPPQSVFEGVEELRPGHVRIYQNGVVQREEPFWTPARYGGFTRLIGRRRRERAERHRRRDPAAHAARRRPGRQLPLRRPRQLATSPPLAASTRARDSRPSRCASRTRSTTRPSYQRLMAQRLGSRAPRGGGLARDIADGIPAGDRARRAADPAHRAGAAVPAVEAGARATASRWC